MSVDPDRPPNQLGLDEADRVLLTALRAWAPAVRDGEANPGTPLLDRLEPSWAQRLSDGEAAGPTAAPGDRAAARDRLRQAHRAEARLDPNRVHASWWIRGLREESPSVRRAIVAAAPGPIRAAVQAGLLLDNDDLRPERPPDPEVLAWACVLWTERLVGGEPDRPDDPPVVAAMSGLSPRAGYRLCRYAGEIKLALDGQGEADWAIAFAASSGPEFAVVARHDVRSTSAAAGKLPLRRLPARIGLLTIGRLLADGEPFRVRWALQHWPYAIAKLIRALMPPAAKRSPVLMHVESEVLRAAWDRV
jgi:hypothetical protein